MKLLTVNCILIFIWYLNYKFVTKKWEICYSPKQTFEYPTVKLNALLQHVCEHRVLFDWIDVHVSLRGQQYPKWELAIRLVYPSFLCKRRSSFNPTNKSNGVGSARQIQTAVPR